MKRKLPRTVVILGLISFLNDMASEMVTPFIPLLIATVLGAGPMVLGLVEGVADAVASFLKLWAGRHSDVLGGKRKVFMVAGYGLSNLVRPLIGLVSSWGGLLVLRSLDRIGKGIRSAPRDALLADAVDQDMRGYAFGFHRALDNAGAVGGSLLAVAALTWAGLTISQVILWSAVPGVLVLALRRGRGPAAGRATAPSAGHAAAQRAWFELRRQAMWRAWGSPPCYRRQTCGS